MLFNHNESNVELDSSYQQHTAIVDEVYNTSITVIDNNDRYYLMKVNEDLVKGDVVTYWTGYYDDIEKGSFDVFYNSTKSVGYGYANDLEIVEKNDDYRSDLYNSLLDENSWYSDMTLMMLYGKEEGKVSSLKDRINLMGVSHLFVVSGFHISLLYVLVEKIMGGLNNNKNLVTFTSFCISAGFLYLVYFPPTGVRAILTLTIARMVHIKKTEALSLTGIIFFIWNPWLLLSSSMILSFSITLSIYIYRPNNISIMDMFVLSMFAFYISLPTVSTWEDRHNLFAPILSMVLTPLVSCFYVISLFVLPFHWLWSIIDLLYELLYLLIIVFSNFIYIFHTPKTNTSQQWVLTILTVYYVYLLKDDSFVLLSTLSIISLIICFI